MTVINYDKKGVISSDTKSFSESPIQSGSQSGPEANKLAKDIADQGYDYV